MTKELKLKTGGPIKPTPRQGVHLKDNAIFGPTWSARKTDEKCVFSFLAAGHGGREIEIEIPVEIYEKLATENVDIDEIIWKYHK